jgi:DNA-binding SARP family transcriptional activator/TolB-like protein
LRDETFRLITLGQLALLASDGSEDASLATRRRKLALLAVLATAGRPLSRGVLAEMFWGDQGEERARHSLSDALSHLRRVLGRDAISARQTDVWISPECRLTVDARELATAAAARDTARVVALYGGPFMDGVCVPRSCAFEQWAARERDCLERLFLAACEGRCFALARSREWDDCATLAARWLGLAPLSVDAGLYRLNALKAPLTRDAYARALVAYDRLVRRLRDEYDLAPDPRVATLADDIATAMRAAPVVATVETPSYAAVAASEPDAAAVAIAAPAPAATLDGPNPNATVPPAPMRRGRVSRWVTVAGSLAITLVLAAPSAHGGSDRVPNAKPVVAVAPVRVLGADRSSAWLGGGVAQLLASDLADSGTVIVVPPERVLSSEGGEDAGESNDATHALGERLGAAWIVDGGLVHGDTLYMLDVSVRETSSGRVVQLFTVTARDMAGLATRAASRVLSTTLQSRASSARPSSDTSRDYTSHS